ncbi:MAG: hypothetical protein EXR81_00685 [Gammaproteobacteria bacterium]|nr:hypothetical protein [Gammaproteobacteria bacterium]
MKVVNKIFLTLCLVAGLNVAYAADCPSVQTAINEVKQLTTLTSPTPVTGGFVYSGTVAFNTSTIYYFTQNKPTQVDPVTQVKRLSSAFQAGISQTVSGFTSCVYLGTMSDPKTPTFTAPWYQVIQIQSSGSIPPPPPPAGNVAVSTNITGLPSAATVTVTFIGSSGKPSSSVMQTGLQLFPNVLPSGFYTVQASDYIDKTTTPNTTYEAQISSQYTLAPPATTVAISYAKFVPPTPGSVPAGWAAGKVTMGTIYDNTPPADAALLTRPVAVAFNYAGESGGGDRGVVLPIEKTKIPQTIGALANPQLNVTQTMPVFIIYTANLSGDTSSLVDIQNAEILMQHYQTLLIEVIAIESYYLNASNPIRSTVILNPDFLGSINKDAKAPDGSKMTATTPLPITYPGQAAPQTVRDVLIAALKAQGQTIMPAAGLFAGNTLVEYVQSLNWIMGTFAPDIPYGWEDADWAGDVEGNNWIHYVPDRVSAHVTVETDFLASTHVFDPIAVTTIGGTLTTTQPTFIGFDKYGANPIYNQVDNTNPGGYGYVASGYLFNTQDWDNYMSFTSQVAKNFKLPLMLWQMPGAHLPEKGESTPLVNLATAPNYFLGPSPAGLNFSFFVNIPGSISAGKYHTPTDVTAGAYLLLNGQNVWLANHIYELQKDNVFAILWGAGGFATGIIPETGGTFDDGGWLYNMIKNAPSYVFKPQPMPIPDPSTLPVYPAGQGSYVSGGRVTTAAKTCVYQCTQTNWCNMAGYGPPGSSNPNWPSAWYSLTPSCPKS